MKHIESLQNPLVKHWVQLLEKSRSRRSDRQFLIEGKREISLAVAGGYNIPTLIYEGSVADPGAVAAMAPGAEIISVGHEVYRKLAYRDSTEGVLALADAKPHALDDLKLPASPLILIAESPEKPGNIGAILRTADAAGVDAVIIADMAGDLYNPNVIRSSVGCVFTTKVAVASSAQAIEFLQANNIDIYAAALQNAVDYLQADFTGSCAIAVGTEATGLTEHWRTAAKQTVMIPMAGVIDSMNVSVAAAVLVFEAVRQRSNSG